VIPPAVKIAILSCKILAHASVAVTKCAFSKIEGTFRTDLGEKKYYDSINDDDESVV